MVFDLFTIMMKVLTLQIIYSIKSLKSCRAVLRRNTHIWSCVNSDFSTKYLYKDRQAV